ALTLVRPTKKRSTELTLAGNQATSSTITLVETRQTTTLRLEPPTGPPGEATRSTESRTFSWVSYRYSSTTLTQHSSRPPEQVWPASESLAISTSYPIQPGADTR